MAISTYKANVAISYPGKFYVKVLHGELSGRGIKEVSCSIANTKKYLVTETAYNKISKANKIEFVNVLS